MRKISMAVVCAVLGLAVARQSAWGAPSAPTLKASVRSDGALAVKWTFSGTFDRATAVMELQRRAPGGTFATLAQVPQPKRRGSWVDRQTSGSWEYRARIRTASEQTAWSPALTVERDGDGPVAPPPPPPPPPTAGSPCPGNVVQEVLVAVNQERAADGVGALTAHPALTASAGVRAATVAAGGVLDHTGWIQAIRAAGYSSQMIGENLAMGYASASSVVHAWMGSSGHRANIVNPYFTASGVACVVDQYGRWWWAHNFGG